MSTQEAHRRSPSPTKSQRQTSRPASPIKGPLHRMLQSITPSPSGSFGGGPKLYETLDQPKSNASRSNSLYNDPTAHGDHLPSDTFSPEPTRPRSRADSTAAVKVDYMASSPLHTNGTVNVYHSDISSDAYHQEAASAGIPPSGSRGRTLSYTSGDAYAPWVIPPQQQHQYDPQPAPYIPQPYDQRYANAHPHHHQPEHSQPGPPLPLPAPSSQSLHRGHSLQEAPHHRSYSPRPFGGQPATSSEATSSHAGLQNPTYMPPAPQSGWQANQTGPRHEPNGPQRRYTYGGPPQGWHSEQQPPDLQLSYQHTPPPPLPGPPSWQGQPSQPPPQRSPSPLPPPPISPRSSFPQTLDSHGSFPYPTSAVAAIAPATPKGPLPSAIPPQSPVSRGAGTVRRSLPQPPGTPPGLARPPTIPNYVPGQTPPTTPTQASTYLKGAGLATPLSPILATPPAAQPSTIAAVEVAKATAPTASAAEGAMLPTGSSPTSASSTTSFAPQASSPINGTALSRSDSILSAAEELMARGMPSRRGRGAFGRFGRSPLSATPATPTANESTDRQHERTDRQHEQPVPAHLQNQSDGGPNQRAENGIPPNEAEKLSEAFNGISLQTGNAAVISEAFTIPKIHSPPPNAAPPVPYIALPDEDDVASAGGPMIAISAPEEESVRAPETNAKSNGTSAMPSFSFSGPDEEEATSGPTINIMGVEDDDSEGNGPVISISGSDAYDDGSRSSGVGMTPSISLSHTSGYTPAMPQRASATSSTSLAEQAARAQAEASKWNGAVPQAPFDHLQSASSVAGTTCGSCSKYIAGRVVQAINQSFHPACFACNHCKELLEHVAFYEHEGKAYCHFDYHELFSLRCFHCRTPIVDERFIQINDPELLSSSNAAAASQKGGKNGTVGGAAGGGAASAGVRYYHDLHFFCANCGDPFIDPKVASSTSGSERGKIQVDEAGRVLSGGKAFVVWKGYPYCESCHHSVHKPSCKACRKPILYDVVTALKGKWHPECFVCEGCKQPFEDERVFVDTQGRGYDEECYRIWLKGTL
ncbi:hypothetical protein BCV69DRAFT_65366 [Microstroma glucosiphilum]|uniref:LIM zinc-binding domain-containing protein n=1 Tax=Pseudomicrostroma glucosiphilum TaxID=1684307 RepID=A0A316U0Z3_9BASI|nr:hypothetical protein BCV69DRAFT_65366 [Pseudomicrostroma glucosiphilum]PWN18870.1 hypothetical protein BCV69DRAFT_65366 [Pseudomicrostroma glucosiphilum]